MRKNLIKQGEEHLKYEIREIVEIGKNIEKRGIEKMIWENIGDPVAKGERIPTWMKDIVKTACDQDKTYAYAPTKGDIEAREFILDHYSDRRVCTVEDIIFFNGLGEAINKIFANLSSHVRVIGPNPTYPSHATAEAMHHDGEPITYSLRIESDGRIDLEELERKVKYNENIAGILIINPNNPTGVVHPRADLIEVVRIARENKCFLIFDEIYQNIVFDRSKITRLSDIVGDVPAISMKGISKEIPWPGARCGWIEVYNADKDESFRAYIHSILVSKMLEVCSTTLPQVIFPSIVKHAEYQTFFQSRIDKYEKRRDQALAIFAKTKYLNPLSPEGVFYLTVPFSEMTKFMTPKHLESKTKEIRLYLDSVETDSMRRDKRFAYELMGSEWVCVVPLSGFYSPVDGFRMTLLEEDEGLFLDTCERIVRGIEGFYRG